MKAVKCKNRVHRLDSEWRAPNGARCEACYHETQRRYEESRLRVGVGGLRFSYRVDPSRKEELKERLAEFRSQQRAEYERCRP